MPNQSMIRTLAEMFCSAPIPDSVCVDPCATVPGSTNRVGTNLLRVPEAEEVFRAMFRDRAADGVLLEVQEERSRQDEKWGTQQDDANTPLDWHETIADYSAWARRMLCVGHASEARRRLIQVAALAVAEVEALDRRFPSAPRMPEGSPCDTCHADENAAEAERERCFRVGIEWLFKRLPDGSPAAQDQLRRQFRSALSLPVGDEA